MPTYRILIVDDYPEAAEIACSLLSLFGHTCQSATCAADALTVADALDPDIGILDLGLPDISGFDLARELRRRPRRRTLYLAALTGWGAPADRARSFAAGFDHHVVKPADANKLTEIIRLADLSLSQGSTDRA